MSAAAAAAADDDISDGAAMDAIRAAAQLRAGCGRCVGGAARSCGSGWASFADLRQLRRAPIVVKLQRVPRRDALVSALLASSPRVNHRASFFTHARGDGSPHAGYVAPRARTRQDSSRFSSVQFRAEQDTDGNGRMARLPLLGGAPPVDLLRLDARRNCRRKHPDALADQTRAVAGDPV